MSNDDVFHYPDVMVACGRDGVEKRINYAQISTVEEHVIASQEAPEPVCHRRASSWIPERLSGPESSLERRSIGLTLPLAEIYARVL